MNVTSSRVPSSSLDFSASYTHDLPGDTFQMISDRVAYLKLSSVKAADSARYIQAAAGTKGLIIDIRNYPSEFVVFALGQLLVSEPANFVRFTYGDVTNPGAFHWMEPLSLTPQQPHYSGKVVILVDEMTQSQAEYTTMAFRTALDAIVIGSTTAGADGDVSMIPLPGGLYSYISGLGVFYPDKRPTQRIGIIPDIEVKPTIEGVRAGRDELIERAIQILTPKSTLEISVPAGGAAVASTVGNAGRIQNGYAAATITSGNTASGTAVLTFKQNGVTVTEAGVPVSPPTTHARIFIDYRSRANAVPARSEAGKIDINTGIAVVNYGSRSANVTYTLLDIHGAPIAGGTGTIGAGNHFARFIHQLGEVAAGFALPEDFQSNIQFASLEITSDQPLSILALRTTSNQRGEALYTSTPIADLTQMLTNTPIYFAQFADGGGYTSSLILLNTSNATETGTLQMLDDSGAPLAVTQVGGTSSSSFNYSIPSGGVFLLRTDGSPAEVKAGWVRLTPDAGTATPVGSGVFGYNPKDILVTESGIPATVSTTHARVYVDLSGNHNTGLAIANVVAADAKIMINAFQKDGMTATGTGQSLQLAGNAHAAIFADYFITGLSKGFTGVLDISSTTPFAALTLRSFDSERDEFLMTAFPVVDMTAPAPSPIIFPQIADGDGYITQFILLSSGTASSVTLSFHDNDGKPLAIGSSGTGVY